MGLNELGTLVIKECEQYRKALKHTRRFAYAGLFASLVLLMFLLKANTELARERQIQGHLLDRIGQLDIMCHDHPVPQIDPHHGDPMDDDGHADKLIM